MSAMRPAPNKRRATKAMMRISGRPMLPMAFFLALSRRTAALLVVAAALLASKRSPPHEPVCQAWDQGGQRDGQEHGEDDHEGDQEERRGSSVGTLEQPHEPERGQRPRRTDQDGPEPSSDPAAQNRADGERGREG